MALLLATSGDGEQLITLMVFDTDLQTLLASLKKGDSLSVMGTASMRAYTDKEGNPATGVTIMVNRLMALAEGKAKSRPKVPLGNGRQQHARSTEFQAAGPRDFAPPEFDDSIPF